MRVRLAVALILGFLFVRHPLAQEAQSPRLEAILSALGASSWAEREAAAKDLVAGWRDWTDADLTRIEVLASGGDLEVAERARKSIPVIRLRRSLGERLVARGIDTVLLQGDETAGEKVLRDSLAAWQAGELDESDLGRLADAAGLLSWKTRRLEIADWIREEKVHPYAPLLVRWLDHPDAQTRSYSLLVLRAIEANDRADRVAECLLDSDEEVRREAAWTLGSMHATGAVPRILLLLDHEEPGLRKTAVEALVALHATGEASAIARLLEDPDPSVRLEAIQALGRFEAAGLAPAIAARAGDPEASVRTAALSTLASLGAVEQAGAVASRLEDEDPALRGIALEILTEWRAREFAPAIARRLGDPNLEIRHEALQGIVRLRAKEHAGDVAALLGDPDPEIRRSSIFALGSLGARDQVPRIAGLLTDEEPGPALAALHVLARLDAREFTGEIAEQLRAEDADRREAALEALADLHAVELAPRIAELLADTEKEVREDALRALGALEDLRALPSILPLLGSPDAAVRGAAARGIGEIGAIDSLPALLALLGDPESSVRWNVLLALERLLDCEARANADAILEDLRAAERWPVREALRGASRTIDGLLADPSPGVRAETIDLLAGMGDREWADDIAGLLSDPEEVVQKAAARALESMEATEFYPLLVPFLAGGTYSNRDHVISVLSEHPSPELVAELVRSFEHTEPAARVGAIIVLRAIGADSEIPRIARLTADPERWVRAEAAEALGKLRARGEVERLAALLADEEKSVADAALEALRAIAGPRDTPERRAFLERLPPSAREAVTRPSPDTSGTDEALAEDTERRPTASRYSGFLRSQDAEVRAKTAVVVAESGAWDAADGVLALLDDRDPSVRLAAGRSVSAMGMREAIPKILERFHELGPEEIKALGELEATETIPFLLQMIEDDLEAWEGERVPSAIWTLVLLDAEEHAAEISRSARNVRRGWAPFGAIAALGALGQKETLREVLGRRYPREAMDYLRDDRTALRLVAGGRAESLARLLSFPDRQIVELALEALVAIDARGCGESIARLLTHPSHFVRNDAIRALAELEARESVPAIARIYASDREPAWTRSTAGTALGTLGAEEFAPDLERGLDHLNFHVVIGSMWGLAGMGSRRAIPGIQALLDHSDDHVRYWSAEALGRLRADEAVRRLAERLADSTEDHSVRAAAAEALGRIGAIEESGALVTALREPEGRIRLLAMHALGRMEAVERADVLVPFLDHVERDIRIAAAEALGGMGGERASEALVARLADPDGHLRQAAIEGLARLGAIDKVEPPLTDRNAPARAAAVRAIGRAGRACFLGRVLALLDDPVPSVRIEAAIGSGRLISRFGTDSAAAEALAILERLERDPDRRVAQAASIALVRLGRKDEASERALVSRVGSFGSPWGWERWRSELADALLQAHEAEAWAKLEAPCSLERPVRSLEDLTPLFGAAGLSLDPDNCRWRGRVAGGKTVCLRQLLENVVGRSERRVFPCPQGHGVRLGTVEDFLARWAP